MTTSTTGPEDAQLTRETWRRFVGAVSNFATCEVRGRAGLLFAVLLALLFGINGLNVVNSYVGRDFMTAIENRNRAGFVQQAIFYLLVFGASTIAAVLFRFTEERLGLLWRDWLTRRFVRFYLTDRAYFRLSLHGALANPDQRIAEDVRTFVTMTLSLCLMFLNGTVTVIAFSGVLWSISRTLFFVGIAYAAVGSLLTVLLGRRLVPLNYRQSDREADFRAELIHVRENAESVALLHREHFLERRLLSRVDALVANLHHIIGVNRNLGFFTTGYNYLIQIIPALIVAPLFIQGDAQFGTITQSAMAFSQLLGAFSLVVTQFQVISSYAAVLARLNALAEVVQPAPQDAAATIRIVEQDDRVAYQGVTLRAPRDGHVLLDDLSAVITTGTRVLVRSDDAAARAALVRATAGLWDDGAGTIVRPRLERIAFLPERPFVPHGTLRDVLLGNGDGSSAAAASDETIHAVLTTLGIDEIVARGGGLDSDEDWSDLLSLREQQLLSIARVVLTRPGFVFLDHPGRTLDAERIASALQALCDCKTTCVTIAGADEEGQLDHYDALLDIAAAGRWTWRAIRDGKIVDEEPRRASMP